MCHGWRSVRLGSLCLGGARRAGDVALRRRAPVRCHPGLWRPCRTRVSCSAWSLCTRPSVVIETLNTDADRASMRGDGRVSRMAGWVRAHWRLLWGRRRASLYYLLRRWTPRIPGDLRRANYLYFPGGAAPGGHQYRPGAALADPHRPGLRWGWWRSFFCEYRHCSTTSCCLRARWCAPTVGRVVRGGVGCAASTLAVERLLDLLTVGAHGALCPSWRPLAPERRRLWAGHRGPWGSWCWRAWAPAG